MQLKFNISLSKFIITQFTIATLIIILGFASYMFTYLTGHGSLLGFIRLFDVDDEHSLPTYFSLLNLLFSSILLYIIYCYEKSKQNDGFYYWLFLTLLFLFLSADVSADIHENYKFINALLANKGLMPSLLKNGLWLPYGVLFTLIIGIGLIPFLRSLPKATFYYFSISALCFITGALGFDYMDTIIREDGFVGSSSDLMFSIRLIFQEGFKIYAIVIFNCALYREILNREISLVINSLSN